MEVAGTDIQRILPINHQAPSRRVPMTLSDQRMYITPPAKSESALGSPPSGTHAEKLKMEMARINHHPNQMPEPPQPTLYSLYMCGFSLSTPICSHRPKMCMFG